jgi:thiamine-monophosphate kinase
MLDRVGGLLGRVGEIVRSCHERWDGQGYPDGLAGDVLHLADASGIGVEVHDAAVPLATGVAEAAALLGRDPVELALGGGEDFALAAALPRTADVGGVVDCGTFTARADRRVRITPAGAALPLAGLAYDHLRS